MKYEFTITDQNELNFSQIMNQAEIMAKTKAENCGLNVRNIYFIQQFKKYNNIVYIFEANFIGD